MQVNWEPSRISGFEVMRKCGDEVRELLHDGWSGCMFRGCSLRLRQCIHFARERGVCFHGAALPDPGRLLQELVSRFMRHVKLRPGTATNAAVLSRLIDAAYADIKARVEHGQIRENALGGATVDIR